MHIKPAKLYVCGLCALQIAQTEADSLREELAGVLRARAQLEASLHESEAEVRQLPYDIALP